MRNSNRSKLGSLALALFATFTTQSHSLHAQQHQNCAVTTAEASHNACKAAVLPSDRRLECAWASQGYDATLPAPTGVELCGSKTVAGYSATVFSCIHSKPSPEPSKVRSFACGYCCAIVPKHPNSAVPASKYFDPLTLDK